MIMWRGTSLSFLLHGSLFFGLVFGLPALPDLFDRKKITEQESELSVTVEVVSAEEVDRLLDVVAPPEPDTSRTRDSAPGKLAPLAIAKLAPSKKPQEESSAPPDAATSSDPGALAKPDGKGGGDKTRIPEGELNQRKIERNRQQRAESTTQREQKQQQQDAIGKPAEKPTDKSAKTEQRVPGDREIAQTDASRKKQERGTPIPATPANDETPRSTDTGQQAAEKVQEQTAEAAAAAERSEQPPAREERAERPASADRPPDAQTPATPKTAGEVQEPSGQPSKTPPENASGTNSAEREAVAANAESPPGAPAGRQQTATPEEKPAAPDISGISPRAPDSERRKQEPLETATASDTPQKPQKPQKPQTAQNENVPAREAPRRPDADTENDRPTGTPDPVNDFVKSVSGTNREIVLKTLAADKRLLQAIQPSRSANEIPASAREKTLDRLKTAASEGYFHAQYNLAGKYLRGEDVEKDPAEAQKWLTRAAEQGFVPAQTLLGLMRFTGVGLPRDQAETAFWWSLAAERGNEGAKVGAELVQRQLNPREHVTAKRLRSRWGSLINDLSDLSPGQTNLQDLNRELQKASQEGDVKAVLSLLARGADADSAGEEGRSAVINAAWRGREQIIQLLLRRGANTELTDDGGATPLIWAAINGHGNAVEGLMENGANPDHRDRARRTALMRAAWNGHRTVVEKLVRAGANLNATDRDGLSALGYARREGHSEIAEILRNAGAK